MLIEISDYLSWVRRLPKAKSLSTVESSPSSANSDGASWGFWVSLVCFLVFQTVFTVFVKVTGDVFGSDYAFFDTQLMNIVYFGLCLPFWVLSIILRFRSIPFLNFMRIRKYDGCSDFCMEQLWIILTSIFDALAAFLYGIGGNGSTGPFQSVTSNFGPFLLQLVAYGFYTRQRKTRIDLLLRSGRDGLRWGISSVVSVLGLLCALFMTVYAPSTSTYPNGGTGYTCSIISFVLAALFTTCSWHVKEYLFTTYKTDAIHLNTTNALHMVWMTFPIFLLQTMVPASWTSCTTSGTIAQNFEVGWKCMRRVLRNSTALGFEDGCASAGWSEWVYAISTWLAGMGQFAFTRYSQSSSFQFLFTVATAAAATCFYWMAPSSWLSGGVGITPNALNICGLILCAVFTWIFSACERDVMERQQEEDDEAEQRRALEKRLLLGEVDESTVPTSIIIGVESIQNEPTAPESLRINSSSERRKETAQPSSDASQKDATVAPLAQPRKQITTRYGAGDTVSHHCADNSAIDGSSRTL